MHRTPITHLSIGFRPSSSPFCPIRPFRARCAVSLNPKFIRCLSESISWFLGAQVDLLPPFSVLGFVLVEPEGLRSLLISLLVPGNGDLRAIEGLEAALAAVRIEIRKFSPPIFPRIVVFPACFTVTGISVINNPINCQSREFLGWSSAVETNEVFLWFASFRLCYCLTEKRHVPR